MCSLPMSGRTVAAHPPRAALPLQEKVLTLSRAFTLPLCLLGTWSISTLHRANNSMSMQFTEAFALLSSSTATPLEGPLIEELQPT